MERPPSDPFRPVASPASVDGSESRARDSLFLAARLRSPGLDETLPVRVRNLSAGGLMVDVALPKERGDPVEVDVRGIGWVPGRVAWCAEGRTGIAFDRPIDPRRARKPVGSGAPKSAQAKGR